MQRLNVSPLIYLLFLLSSSLATSQENRTTYTQNVYGGTGLLQTPTARFSDDGEFIFGISAEKPYYRLYATLQYFPWLEGVVRYSEGTYQAYVPNSKQTWKDKGIDLKFRLFEETEKLPQIAFGLTDLGGSGSYSSEYIVASKKIDNFDFTLGLGWGRLAGSNTLSNPAGWFFDSKKILGGGTQFGGKINFGKLFSGPNAAIFGGFEYQTPIPNLSFKAEYDSSNYSDALGKEINFDEVGNIFEVDSRLNYALNYKYKVSERDQVDLSFGFIRGNTYYTNLTVRSNLNFSGTPKIIMGPEKLKRRSLKPFQELPEGWKDYLHKSILWQMGNGGIATHQITYNGDELIAEISQSRFKNTVSAIDLASRILANNSPRNIKRITVVNLDQGIETLRATVDRNDLIKAVAKGAADESIFIFNERSEIEEGVLPYQNEYMYPHFSWSIRPHMLGTLQHQERFYYWQLEALIHTEYSIKKGLYLTADIGIDLANNYETYTYHVPDGKLHHVRQDRRLYLTEGKTGLRRFALDYLTYFSPNLVGKFSAGYIEWMYGGFGGEVLYFPGHKRWAVGIDAYWLKQREYDQRFSFRDYETVTGFLSYYQNIPFYDMRLRLSAGRFLGKDKGIQVDVSRRFETGARVGAMVSLTDCDAACVGEGSFNKWIYFELPMELFYVRSGTRNKAGFAWAPLTKDAGTRVDQGHLYTLITDVSDEIETLRTKNWSLKKIFKGFGTKPREQS